MPNGKWFLSLVVLLAGCVTAPIQPKASDFAQVEAASPAPAPLDLDANLARLSEWFAGEWDNFEQVQRDAEAPRGSGVTPHERIHALFLPVSVPAIGGSVFYARQTLDDDPTRVFRLRLYRFTVDDKADAIRLDQYSFNDEKAWNEAHRYPERLATLTSAQLRYAPDCAVYFKFDAGADEFVGSTRPGACIVGSERLSKAVVVEDRIQLGADKLWILSTAKDQSGRMIYGNAEGVPHQQRKVRYFSGWVAINTAGANARPEDRAFHTITPVILHSEGRRAPITWADGRRSGYSVQLARLSVDAGKSQVLTLKVLDDATGLPVSYSWSDPESRRIGISLRWFQSDFSEIEGDSRFEPVPGS
ncbi:MAG: chromophore lyase CpcT/CpeT [Xanthomonadales bacterium]|nr:chromophore lyase CpcT/CpeT [Xanthomonadales bacterium]